MRVDKPLIHQKLIESGVLGLLIDLIGQYPWNNVLQIKTTQIFKELLENQQIQPQIKIDLFRESEVCSKLVRLADTPEYQFKSERKVRNGYMGFVIELSNIITKRVEQENLADYAPEIFENEDWKHFCQGELD